MTDEEIEFALKQYVTGGGRNVMNMDWAGTLDYINRLKAERDYWKAQFEWQAEQDKNALIGERQAIKDTAKEILKKVLYFGRDTKYGEVYPCDIKKVAKKYGVEVDDE